MALICYIEGELYDSGTTALAIEMLLLSSTVTPQPEACGIDSSSLLPLFLEMPVSSILYQTLETMGYSERNFESANSGYFFLVLSQSPNTLKCHSEAP